MGRKGKGKGGRKPTYRAATRLARLVLGLRNRPFGWSFEAILDELGITERTLLRYIDACREELVDEWTGKPLLEVSRRGERRVLRLAEGARSPDSTVWEAASLYFLLTEAGFVDGTILRECLDSLLDRSCKSLTVRQQARLENLERKFFTISEGSPQYGSHDDQLDIFLRAIIDQYRVRIELDGPDGAESARAFEPCTLLNFRGRLFVVGRDAGWSSFVMRPLERFRRVALVEGEDGRFERFEFPDHYHPSHLAAGTIASFDAETDEAGADGSPPGDGDETGGTLGLRRRGPRRASRTTRNKRRRPLFGRTG